MRRIPEDASLADIKVGDVIFVKHSGGITWSTQPYKDTSYLTKKRVSSVHEDGSIGTNTGGYCESFNKDGYQRSVRPAGKIVGIED